MNTLLQINHLQICYPLGQGRLLAVDDVSFSLPQGAAIGLAGESGCGKSSLGLAIPGLLPRQAQICGGQLLWQQEGKSQDLLRLTPKALQQLRGREIGMIFQDPLSSLDPVWTIGGQLGETIAALAGEKLSPQQLEQQSLHLLEQVGFDDPQRILACYPHQLSGGQRQRALIGLALAGSPRLLIADEPTTALDAVLRQQLLQLLSQLRQKLQMSLLLISHDLSLLAAHTSQILVMYCGKIVEQGPTAQVFAAPAHPYTQALLASRPQKGGGLPTALPGQAPLPLQLPQRCYFYPRCPRRQPCCQNGYPPEQALSAEHRVCCYFGQRSQL